MPLSLASIRPETADDRHPVPPRCRLVSSEPSSASQGSLNEDLRALEQFKARSRFVRNETIFSEGDKAGYVYKIISGTVRLCKHTQDGRRHIADFMLAGDIFGIMGRDHYGFSAEAVTDVLLLSYPRSHIDRLLATKPGMAERILTLLADKLVTMQRHLVVLGCQNAKERVASFLLRLAERTQTPSGERIDLTMGRQDIASHLGLTVETVCRAIAELKREGALSVPNLHQLVLNTGVLRAPATRRAANGTSAAPRRSELRTYTEQINRLNQ